MDCQILIFCELIKETLNFGQASIEETVDWDKMVKWSKHHNIMPLILETAAKRNTYMLRTESSKEITEAINIVALQAKRNAFFELLYKKFVSVGIYPIVMKGIVCRQLYGKMCDHRPSVDEDILIKISDYDTVKQVLLDAGFVMLSDNVIESQLERVQEISFFNEEEKFHIEVHLNVMGKENVMREKMSSCFEHVNESYVEIDINGTLIRTMNPNDHILFLILHAFKHFTIGGVGIRQIVDILLFYKKYYYEIDLIKLQNSLSDFQANDFLNDLIYIGNRYWGFDISFDGVEKCAEDLLEDIMLSGSFGNETEAERIAGRMIMRTAGEETKGNISCQMIWTAIFPSKSYMLDQAPYLYDKSWLLPYAWVKRWLRFFAKRKQKNINESLKINKRRMKLLKEYNII